MTADIIINDPSGEPLVGTQLLALTPTGQEAFSVGDAPFVGAAVSKYQAKSTTGNLYGCTASLYAGASAGLVLLAIDIVDSVTTPVQNGAIGGYVVRGVWPFVSGGVDFSRTFPWGFETGICFACGTVSNTGTLTLSTSLASINPTFE